MSLLFRSRGVAHPWALALAGALWLAPAAFAAEVFYQPVVSLATAYNTNVELDPLVRHSAEGYYADASSLIGIATPTSETTIVPRILYNYYPSESDLDRLEGFLNLNSRFTWRRDRFTITGFFDHRDDVNAEQPGAEINPVNPGLGNTTPDSGRVQVGTTRNFLVLDPTYSHLITPLSSIGVGGEYQRLSFSPDDQSSHIDFNYYSGKVFYGWTQSPRTDFSVSAFGSRFVAGSIDSTSTSEGVAASMAYSWSQALTTDVSALYQRTKFIETDPNTVDETSNQWGANISTVYNGPASSYRVGAGRIIAPSATGGLFATDQIRGQYDRDFTQRLHFTGALRYFRDQTVAGVGGSDTRNYLTSFVKLQWMVTPKMFIAGAYTYVWQKYRADPNGADASVVSFTIGYRGLDRQR